MASLTLFSTSLNGCSQMPLRTGQGTRGIPGELEASQKEAEEAQEQAVTRLWSWVCPSPGALPPGVGVWVGALASPQ